VSTLLWSDIDLKRLDVNYRDAISQMKRSSFEDALAVRILVTDEAKNPVGYLVPVGGWLLSDEPTIQKISDWRRRFNRMFPTRTSVDSASTKIFLNKSYIENVAAILFLVFTESDELVGHMGLRSMEEKSFELVNLMRGASGGHNDLIYFAELRLVYLGFQLGGYEQCVIEIMSYNWIASDLHRKVGFVRNSSSALCKVEDSTGVRHQKVQTSDKNIDYTIDTMILERNKFYLLHSFQ
jgi:hypothetical protein